MSDAVEVSTADHRAGLFSLDLATHELKWSRGMYSLLGYDPDSTVPTPDLLYNLMLRDGVSGTELHTLIKKGIPFQERVCIRTPSGTVRWLLTYYDFKLCASGAPEKLFGICIEVSGRDAGS